jgi:hypothetical protein
MLDLQAVQHALAQAEWAKVIRILDGYFDASGVVIEGYPLVKNSIKNQLFQGLQPTLANIEAIHMIIEDIKESLIKSPALSATPAHSTSQPTVQDYSEIKRLVAQSEMEQALTLLEEKVPARLKNDVYTLQNQWAEVTRLEMLRTRDFNEISLRKTQIAQAILELCDRDNPTRFGRMGP